MYKVFFNDRTVFIGTTFKKSLIQQSLFFDPENEVDVRTAWNMFLNDIKKRDLFLVSKCPEDIKSWFFSIFKIVEAAGGWVINSKNELLCINRLGKWDLPKGKIEKNESSEAAALREVEEECGIHGMELIGLKTVTFHIYISPKNRNKYILKPTYWYNMSYNRTDKLIPQLDEDIIEVRWFDKTQLPTAKGNTYASLKPLFEID